MAGKLEVTGYVLDTSVIIKWFSAHGEDDLDSALLLRDGLVSGNCTATVPDLILYELANALRHNPNFTSDDVKDAVAAVDDMGFAVRCADAAVMARAVETAFAYNVTVYDAYFLALAESEGTAFVTADYRFFERVKKAGNIVRLDRLYR
ncbi:MAG: PilT protein domain-containing [Geobacteraceae bacterium]|nr:MAG: PilT protein domain-containing [Geobacteraceae bacterium]